MYSHVAATATASGSANPSPHGRLPPSATPPVLPTPAPQTAAAAATIDPSAVSPALPAASHGLAASSSVSHSSVSRGQPRVVCEISSRYRPSAVEPCASTPMQLYYPPECDGSILTEPVMPCLFFGGLMKLNCAPIPH